MDAARREPLRVAVELLEARANEPHLVGLVVDREVRAVAEPIGLAAQDPPAGAWNVSTHMPRDAADELLDPLAHLARGTVREGDREDLVRLSVALGEQVRDAARKHARLARAGAGDDEHRPARVHHGLALLRVQSLEEPRRGRDLRHPRRVATGPGGFLRRRLERVDGVAEPGDRRREPGLVARFQHELDLAVAVAERRVAAERDVGETFGERHAA